MWQNNIRAVVDLGVARDDDIGALEDTLRCAVERCDVVITSGGVSVGSADHMKDILNRLGKVRFDICAELLVVGSLRSAQYEAWQTHHFCDRIPQ